MSRTKTRTILLAEFGAIYFLVPFAIWRQWLPVPLVLIPLYILAAYAVWWLVRHGGVGVKRLWVGDDSAAEKALLKIIALRFVAVTVMVLSVVVVFYPEKLFVLPATHPFIWLALLVLYPPLSVLAQEVLYRAFFFARYRVLFRT